MNFSEHNILWEAPLSVFQKVKEKDPPRSEFNEGVMVQTFFPAYDNRAAASSTPQPRPPFVEFLLTYSRNVCRFHLRISAGKNQSQSTRRHANHRNNRAASSQFGAG
ncbi:hypothetical protein JTE90_029645 [Oedothorax gibbosus]|uniref:Uncharacterized protein n=1 Tax=Oedothorax gibbosus TaxID=931172 RepID=A0AAV6VG68_9ARAC|nr:hypothetical protein JTE90_029645 [Oedothorax gibbosus]